MYFYIYKKLVFMKFYLLHLEMKKFFFCWIFIIPIVLFAQIEKQMGKIQYQEVFVDTDDFQLDYLHHLEHALFEIPEFAPLRLKIVNDLGYYYHTRNLNTALKYVESGLKEAISSDQSYWQGRLLVSKGAILLRMEKLDQAEKVLNEAIPLIPEKESWLLYTNLGYVYERRGMLGEAFKYASKTLEIGEKYKDPKAIAMAYSDISNLFWKQGKIESAYSYGIKSIEIFEKRGLNDLDYDFTLHLLGQYLTDLGRLEEGLVIFQRSVEIGEQYGFYNNLSDNYIALANLQSRLKNFLEARKSGLAALRYAELLENDFMIMRSYLALGKVSNAAGDFGTAAQYLEISIEKATENFGDKYYLSLVYDELSKSYEGSKAFEDALKTSKKSNQLQDEVFTLKADEQVARLQTQMQVAQKENTIKLQKAKLSRQQIIQLLYLTVGAVLIVILFLLYRVYIRKKSYSLLLEKKNEEKEFLLREIHHRIKNNLETISSLLSLQISKIENRELQQVMEETYTRVQSMGMIHLQLYRQENLNRVEMRYFFNSLGQFILETFDAEGWVDFEIDMAPLELDVDLAIPIGLIVNELVSNSLKYAFPNQEKGTIKVSLFENGEILLLEVADNGVGIQSDLVTQGTGFGSELISLLTRQLDGKMTLIKSPGATFSFKFLLNKAA